MMVKKCELKVSASAMILFILGAVLIPGETNTRINIAKACPLYCLDVKYMTCASSGEEHLSPHCNCCLAPKNCTLHLADGSQEHCP